jgi:hypothetical protein
MEWFFPGIVGLLAVIDQVNVGGGSSSRRG